MNNAYILTIIAWAIVLIWIPIVIFNNKKYHPKALFILFFAEAWERFSYYGMRALLVLYMVSEIAKDGLGYNDERAYGVYAAYGALVYATPILGGLIADRLFGYRKAIMWGLFLWQQATLPWHLLMQRTISSSLRHWLC